MVLKYSEQRIILKLILGAGQNHYGILLQESSPIPYS